MRRADLPQLQWGDEERARAEAAARRAARWRIAIAVAGIAALALPMIVKPLPRLVWNATPSSPTGLYLVAPGTAAARGETVAAWLPTAARWLADRRRYVPAAVPVIKSVAAVGGDRVCADGALLTINGRVAASRLATDRRGRPLPRWAGCTTLGDDAILLLAAAPNSFDGRYFGVMSRRQLIGTARLIWAR